LGSLPRETGADLPFLYVAVRGKGQSMGESETSKFGDRPADPLAKAQRDSKTTASFKAVGYWDGRDRLYLNKAGTQYLEFRPEDVRKHGDVDAAQSPFVGEQATWVELDPKAQVTFVRTGPAGPADDDLLEVSARGTPDAFSADLASNDPRQLCVMTALLCSRCSRHGTTKWCTDFDVVIPGDFSPFA
jgi:hypothetical protein